LVEIKRIHKFGDLIELEISLINEIRSLIKEIPKFGANSGPNCKKLKIQGPKWICCDTIGGLINFSRGNFGIILSWKAN